MPCPYEVSSEVNGVSNLRRGGPMCPPFFLKRLCDFPDQYFFYSDRHGESVPKRYE